MKVPKDRAVVVGFQGRQGCGKGTQAVEFMKKMIADGVDVTRLDMGHHFREVKEDSAFYDRIHPHIVRGTLVPDEVTVGFFQEVVGQPVLGHCYINDGYPRNRVQAESFCSHFLENSPVPCSVAIVHIDLERQRCIDRLTERAKKQNRPDDADPVIINNRLDLYEELFGEIQKVFQEYDVPVIRVHGDRTQTEVLHAVISGLRDVWWKESKVMCRV